jgi:hypothetical protein
VYGLHDYQLRLLYYLKRMDDRRPAILLDEEIARWRWTRSYVENVAVAIALAVAEVQGDRSILVWSGPPVSSWECSYSRLGRPTQ